MKFKVKKSTVLEILFIFLLSLTPLLWFRPGEIMVGHDNVFPFAPKTFLKGRLYTWIQNQGFGLDQSLIMGTIPIHLIDALPSFFGFSLQATQKLVYIFWFFLIGLSVYIFASLINPKSRFFKLFVTVFYQFNFFVLQGWFIGERTKFSAYIALPLVLSVFLLVYREKIAVLRGAIYSSLILFFFNAGGLFGIPLYGGFFVCIGVFIIFFSLLSIFQKKYQLIKALILVSILTLIGLLLLDSYYLLPIFGQFLSRYGVRLGEIGGLSGVLAWAKEISFGASFINLFRLQGIAEWYDNPEHPYAKYFLNNNLLILISFLWPLLVFSSLIFIRDKKKTRFIFYFFLVYLISLFFVAGVHPPLGFAYTFLIKIIPGFSIFRSPYFKFAPALFFASAFLCAFTLDWLKEKIGKRKILVSLFCLFWFTLLLGYHFPYFTGNFFNWRKGFSTRLKIPNYIFEFSYWLDKEWEEDSRILMLPPTDPRWQYELYKWGYLSFNPLPRLFTNKAVIVNGENLNETERKLLDLVSQSLLEEDKELFEKITASLRITHLLVRDDFAYNLDWAKTENPKQFRKVIEEKFRFPLKKQFGEWYLYELNNEIKPKIFASQNPNLLKLPVKLLDSYYSLVEKDKDEFIFNELLEDKFDLIGGEYFVPRCLNCRLEREKKILLSFPEKTILPESPFYPLMLFKEQMVANKQDLQANIYHHLGLTIKRLGEIRELIYQKKEVKKDQFEAYQLLIEKIGLLFKQLEDSDEKYKVAEDINGFLEEEQKFLRILIGRPLVTSREKVAEVKTAISSTYALQAIIDPWLVKQDRSNHRFYSFDVIRESDFGILVKSETIKGAFLDKDKISLEIDNQYQKEIIVKPEDFENEWLNFGKIKIKSGNHKMMVSLPEIPNLAGEFIRKADPFWRGGMGSCFVSEMKHYDGKKDYLMRLYYRNDFSDNLRLFFVRQKDDGSKKEDVFNLDLSYEDSLFEEIIYADQETEDFKLYLCAPEFSDITTPTAKKIKLEIKEIIYPLVVFYSKPRVTAVKQKLPLLEFQEVNPTKYHLKIHNASQPYFLAFLEKFDPNWKVYYQDKEIAGQNHFNFNAYANSWLINKQGDYDLVVEYYPQRYFYRGLILTILTILGMLAYLYTKKPNIKQ